MRKISRLANVLLAFREGLCPMVSAKTLDIKHVQKCGYIQVFWTQMARILFNKISNSTDHFALIGTMKLFIYDKLKRRRP
jgi:hypothetical protein